MAKIIKLHKNISLPESDVLRRTNEEKAQEDLDERKRENARKDDIHQQNIRDSNTNHIFKKINQSILLLSKITALIFTIFLVFASINNYFDGILIPNELLLGIPVSATFITDIPNDICKIFKKTPP